jgi:hypothetical protein
MMMTRKQATQKGQSPPVKSKASKRVKSVLDSALEVQSEEEGTQPFAVSKSATLQAKKDAENRKKIDAVAEAEEIFQFQETDSSLNLSNTKRKSTQQNKAESKARNDIASGSESDSIAELEILIPKKSSTRKDSKLDSSANISDDEQAVSTRSKSRIASEAKGRTSLRLSPRKNLRSARDSLMSSTEKDLSPKSKLKSAANAKRSTRMTSKKSPRSPNKSVVEQVSSGDSDLEILSPKKPSPSKPLKSGPLNKRTAVAIDSSKNDEVKQAKMRKPNDESYSSDDSVLFKSHSTPGKTTPKATKPSSKTTAGPSNLRRSLVVSLTPLKMTKSLAKNLSDISQSQKEDRSTKADPEGTKIITGQGTQSSSTKRKKPKSFNLSDDDSDKAAKVEPKRLVRPNLKKASTMANLLDSDGASSSDSDETFSKAKLEEIKRKKSLAASSSKKDEGNKMSEEEEELIGVQNMIEHLQSTSFANEVQKKTSVTTRQNSLLRMLEVDIPADENRGELKLWL